MNFADLNTIQNLGTQWCEASKKNFDTTGRMKLYEDTERVISFICKNSEKLVEINNLCSSIIQELSSEPQSQKLAEWIALNTGFSEGEELNGAYPVFHKLFEAMGMPNDFKEIDVNAHRLITSQTPSEYGKNVGKIYYSSLSTKELLALDKTSRKDRSLAMDILIDRLNAHKIIPAHLGIITVADLINFFGPRCSEIVILDLRGFSFINDMDKLVIFFPKLTTLIFKEYVSITEEFASSFSKMTCLKNLDLSKCEMFDDLSFLQGLQSLETLSLSNCAQTNDFSKLQNLTKLTSLNLSGCNFTDVNFLQNLTHLKELNLQKCFPLSDITSLKGLQKLRRLDFFGNHKIENFSSLKDLFNLESLDLSSCFKITDISILRDLLSLENLNLSKCFNITDFKVLKNLPSLKNLNLTKCKNLDVKLLKDLQSLEELELDPEISNQIDMKIQKGK